MNIQFILSDTSIGATSGALKEVIAKAESDAFSNVLVLVPEPKSIAIERELLDLSKNGAFANIFIYSFVRLLSRIGGIAEHEIVSRQTSVMILRNLILENLDKLSCYKKTAKTIGFAENVYETIEQFKSSSYTLQDVWNLANNAEGALKAKMQDIALLFELFESELANGLLDDCDRLRKLGQLAETSQFIKDADVFIVGFDNVTMDMIEVLKQFAINSKSITFSCVYFNENRKDKYIQDNELYKKFKSIADRLKFPYNPRFVKSAHSGDFWNIQNYLYSTEAKQIKSNGSVQIFEHESKTKEFDWLANQILTEIKAGKRFRDIAVIDSNLDKDAEAISKIFDEYNIPHFITKSYDISQHYFVRFIKNSIEVITSRFSAEKVLKWLSSPLLELEGLEEFELLVKAQGINYTGFLNFVDCKISDEEKLDKINRIFEFIKEFNLKFSEVFLKDNKISIFVSKVMEIAEFVNAQVKIERIASFQREHEFEVDSEISSVIFDKFLKINYNITKFLGQKVVSAQEFLQIYLSGFAEEEVNIVPVSIDTVLVQKKSDGLYKIKQLFVIGAVEGQFPVKMADTGMLQDMEIESLSSIASKQIEPTIKQINKREKFMIYELMLLPSEKLFVSYSTHAFGANKKRANIVERLLKLFNLEVIKTYKCNHFITQKSAEKQFAEHVGLYLCDMDFGEGEINAEFNKIKNNISPKFNEYISNLSFGTKEFKIKNAKEIYFLNNKTSVSQLEKYFACPYSFFARYGLRLKENKDASLNSLDIGTIVHKFAELFTNNIKQFEALNDKEFDKNVRVILEKALVELNINKTKNVAVLKFISDEAVRLAHYLFSEQEKSSFKNNKELNEFEFFGNNAVKIQVDENLIISIEGKIDRIDCFGDYIRIIDYKTGDTDSGLESIYFGKKIQLVSYLSAAENLSEKKIAGLFYFPIHSDFVKIHQKLRNNYKMQGFLLDDVDVIKYMDSGLSIENNESDFVPLKIKNNKETRESGEFQISYGRTKTFLTETEFGDIKAYTKTLCGGAISEILDGNIEPSPIAKISEKESSICKYCELEGFCGKEYSKFGQARRCGGEIDALSFNTNKGEE